MADFSHPIRDVSFGKKQKCFPQPASHSRQVQSILFLNLTVMVL